MEGAPGGLKGALAGSLCGRVAEKGLYRKPFNVEGASGYKGLRVGGAVKGLHFCAFILQAVGLHMFIPKGAGLFGSGGSRGSLSGAFHIKSPSLTPFRHVR